MFRKAIKAVLVGLLGVCALVSAAAIAKEEMPEVTTDGLVLMIGARGWRPEDRALLELATSQSAPVIVCINKIDRRLVCFAF